MSFLETDVSRSARGGGNKHRFPEGSREERDFYAPERMPSEFCDRTSYLKPPSRE